MTPRVFSWWTLNNKITGIGGKCSNVCIRNTIFIGLYLSLGTLKNERREIRHERSKGMCGGGDDTWNKQYNYVWGTSIWGEKSSSQDLSPVSGSRFSSQAPAECPLFLRRWRRASPGRLWTSGCGTCCPWLHWAWHPSRQTRTCPGGPQWRRHAACSELGRRWHPLEIKDNHANFAGR